MAKRRSPEEYAEMSRAVEAGEYTVAGPLELGASLRMGRPVGRGGERRGASPTRTVRLPAELEMRLEAYVSVSDTKPSDVIRQALDEYLNRHPIGH